MSQDLTVLSMLSAGLAALGLDLSLSEPLFQYLKLLQQWNKAYNLTAVRNIEDMVGRHVLDSLAILPWIRGDRVLDVGTGAGLPGIPLAIACPEKQMVLLDSNGKKICFLREVNRALGLMNVALVQSRVEQYQPEQPFTTVVSRAFSEVAPFLKGSAHVLAPQGVWVAMKGPHLALELAKVSRPYQVEPYVIPGVNAERYCVIIES